jgi:hypothetical protein
MEKGFSGRNCLNDFEGRLGKMLKNSLGIKASVFLKTRILGVVSPKNRRLSLTESDFKLDRWWYDCLSSVRIFDFLSGKVSPNLYPKKNWIHFK